MFIYANFIFKSNASKKFNNLLMNKVSPVLENDAEHTHDSENCLKKRYNWYQALDKPKITPPVWVFPLVWTIIYIMIALSGYYYIIDTNY